MNRYAFYGLRRSGNHAILEWLIQNMGDRGERKVVKSRRLMAVNSAAYINEANTYSSYENLEEHHALADETYKTLIVSYEDVGLDYVLPITQGYRKIVIIRDLPNLFASRYKKSQAYGHSYKKGVMRIDEKAIELWKDHAISGLNGSAILIQFEKWLDAKEYRDELAASFNAANHDITDTITEFGEGSSFSGQLKPTVEELKTRFSQVALPRKVRKRVQEEDINDLRRQLGYIE